MIESQIFKILAFFDLQSSPNKSMKDAKRDISALQSLADLQRGGTIGVEFGVCAISGVLFAVALFASKIFICGNILRIEQSERILLATNSGGQQYGEIRAVAQFKCRILRTISVPRQLCDTSAPGFDHMTDQFRLCKTISRQSAVCPILCKPHVADTWDPEYVNKCQI